MEAFFFSRKDLSVMHGVLWERDEDVEKCRSCKRQFALLLRRHHCRGCGGVFCETCTSTNVHLHDEPIDRACGGCLRGETPGPKIESLVETALAGHLDEMHSPANLVPMLRGSLYPQPGDAAAGPAGPAASPVSSGYFEFVNKGDSPVCLKLLANCSDHLWEVPRPSYIVVPPNGFVHGHFQDASFLHFILLANNPLKPAAGASMAVDPSWSSVDDFPPHLKVQNFEDFAVYRVGSTDCNVLLKYKGGSVELRKGGSVARVGIFGALVGGGAKPNCLDFATNSTFLERVYSSY